MSRALILLSGGIDSAVCLALAHKEGYTCYALSFDYQQRHRVELESASFLAQHYAVPHTVIKIAPQTFGRSSLVGEGAVPKGRSLEAIHASGITNTYVPARNTLFLAYALGQAELLQADKIFIGANADDINGFPDCRPAFFQAFQALANCATQQATERKAPLIQTPLAEMHKPEIIQLGLELNVPLERTSSCYAPREDGSPCKECDPCILRADAFRR